MTTQTRVSLLEQKVVNLDEAINKHLESTDEQVARHQEILINNGRGLVYRVGKIENYKEASNSRFAAVLSTLAVLLSLLSVIIQLMK